MKRHALLIDSGKADKDKPILGSHLDINNVAKFLMSPLGGAWDRGELDPVSCPSIVKLLEMIDRANGADYVFLFYTGHGGLRRSAHDDPACPERTHLARFGD